MAAMRPGLPARWLLATASLLASSCLEVADVEQSPKDASADGSTESLKLLPAKPPPRPAGAREPSGKGGMRWFAARRVFSGTVDPLTLERDLEAWQKLGHDLDGECTSEEQSEADESGVCKKQPTARADALMDGDDCRDNGYGKIFAHVAEKLKSSWELNFHAEVANGGTTLLLRLSDLDAGPNDPFVPGAVYLSVPRATTPAWKGEDQFQIRKSSVDGELVTDPPKIAFPKGYLSGNVWVSSELGASPGEFPLFLLREVVMTNLLSRTLVVALDDAHERALGSAFSAVIARAAILSDLTPLFVDMVGCDTSLSNLLLQSYVLPSADVGTVPPTFVSPGAVCQGLSVGAALQWVPIRAPVEVVDPPAPAVCDGGPGG